MASVGWHAEEGVEVERALSLGRSALASVSTASPVLVYVASLAGEARVLGAYQREEDALAPAARASVHRRVTGGPAVIGGEGITYAALALARAGALMECPRERVLNRNVRPFLAALRQLGASAHYFGREFVSVDRRPAALVAWTREPSGAVLIEVVLGVERPFALPGAELGVLPSAPRMLGKEPLALASAMRPFAPRELAEALAGACASMKPLAIEARPLAVRESAEPLAPTADRWSSPREVPIGIVRAGLSFDERGVIAGAALAGDFFQDADAPARLRASLVGGLPGAERFRDAINATYGPHGAVIEGLRSLQPVLDAFLELAP